MRSKTLTIAGLFLALALVSCDSGGKAPSESPTSSGPDATTPGSTTPRAAQQTVTDSGLAYTVLKEGQGTSPKLGDTVLIHCVGRLANGVEFWNTRKTGVPQEEVLSYDQLIAGVVESLLSMKPGERRQVHIPSRLGYGIEGYPGKVPANADLEMDLELVSIVP